MPYAISALAPKMSQETLEYGTDLESYFLIRDIDSKSGKNAGTA